MTRQTGAGTELLAAGETMAMIAPAVSGRLADAALFIVDAGGRVVALGSALEDLTQLSQLAELLKQRKETTGGTWPT